METFSDTEEQRDVIRRQLKRMGLSVTIESLTYAERRGHWANGGTVENAEAWLAAREKP